MGIRVWLAANTLLYPEGGGHLWAYLNWALGLREAGCDLVWLEGIAPDVSADEIRRHAAILRDYLRPYGLAERIALTPKYDSQLPAGAADGYLDASHARGADLLVNISYDPYPQIVEGFRRTALVDIDPGMLQLWHHQGEVELPPHDAYFTIGERIGTPGAEIPTGGIPWQHTFPCVSLDAWPVCVPSPDAAYTTISHWYSSNWIEFNGESFDNDKRTAFLKYIDLPQRVAQPLELALCLGTDEQHQIDPYEAEEARQLTDIGWRIRHAYEVASTPAAYHRYIQESLGEYSCAKPAYTRLKNAWISDRTVCYLASGKPVVVEHTGPSDFLPDADGLFRFRSLEEAIRGFEILAADYPRQCRRARALAESLFDARKVAESLIERAMR